MMNPLAPLTPPNGEYAVPVKSAMGTTKASSSMRPRPMSRLRAERVIAAAQRLSPYSEAADNSHNGAKIRSPSSSSSTSSMVRSVSSSVSTTHDNYLRQSGVQFLLEDLVKRLTEERPDQVALYMANYFADVVQGNHVRTRAFEFINGTLQNRIAFVSVVQRSVAGVDPTIEITSDDFAEIIACHCSDLPSVLLRQACSHLDEAPEGAIVTTLQDFLTAFGTCFVYNEFLTKVHDVYTELVLATRDTRAMSPHGSNRSDSIASAMAADRVVARLRLIAQQNTAMIIPPLVEVEVFVFQSASFKEFCALFFLSPAIIFSIRELQSAFECLSSHESQIC